jgi:universal bacterial protein YeaZ
MKIILDTSNQYLAVALYKENQCLDKIQEYGSQRQSENAIPYLSKILEKNKVDLLDVDEVVITRGPGSYTGVRVAMTIAKTLNVIQPIQLKAISSLKAYAGLNRCVSVIDARSQKVFVCAYDNGKELCEEQMIPIDEFSGFMKQYPDFEVVGQRSIVGKENKEVDLIDNLYQLSLLEKDIECIDALVPRYLKDIEVKKICL